MSVAKVETVKSSRKDQGVCGKCKEPLPKGTGYRYFYVGFRSNFKQVRCLKPECAPRPSERESSKVATWYAAQETFEDQIDHLDNKDDIESAVQEAGSSARELADEYRESADAWENGNEQLQEKADHWESQADEIENWTFEGDEEPEQEDGEPEDTFNERHDAWLDGVREAAREAIDSVDVG